MTTKTFQPAQLIRPDIAAMEPYTPILPFEVLSAQLGRHPDQITKLDANENPYGPAPAVREALHNGRYYHIYPDPQARALRALIADYTNTPTQYLLAGAGADELIDLALRAILQPGDGVINCPPSFGMYPWGTAVNGAQLITVPRHDDFSLDIPAIEAAAQTNPNAKILFICSPNNPNGSLINDTDLRRLLHLPLLVILDEAYIEFATATNGTPSRITWVQEHDNLVVLRTFSKLAGLAGLRVGYGAFPAWLSDQLWKIKQPYNINVAADLAAQAALQNIAWLEDKVAKLVAERDRMVAALAAYDWLQPYPSYSNFVLFRVLGRSAAQLKADLAAQGVLVRYFNKPGLDNCIRISAGRPQDTDNLLQALTTLSSRAQ
ncbi:MAG TPA: histidinol-phosphate transaminase [Anaerolineae bacterium]|nr:histidinol-phosphate transaminase [Anaerolineae bacterium]